MKSAFNLSILGKSKESAIQNLNIKLEAYNENWPELFKNEAKNLMADLPPDEVLEFHHIGSTAIPGMMANPVIDIAVMVNSTEAAKEKIVPVMQERGYEYQWREDQGEPFMFFSKDGYNIYMAEEEHSLWERPRFRDYLIKLPEEAKNYLELKKILAEQFPNDPLAYTRGKAEYIRRVTDLANKKAPLL